MNNGLKPLNSLLDSLNYITLLTNIPTAAYDAKYINEINVEYAKNDEKFIGFDEKQYSLTTNDIVIKSNNKIICLAGILGDNKYGITETTDDAYIEFANFNFVNIRKTAQKFSITTDAAKRNSKEITNYNTIIAAKIFEEKFKKYISGITYSIKCNNAKSAKLDIKYMSQILGIKLNKKDVVENLISLGFKIDNEKVYFPR
jgi:phenylalanyl-tRNA synthetase beta chain